MLVSAMQRLEGGGGGGVRHTFHTAPLDALYQTSPGRGLVAPTLAMLITTPPSPRSIACPTHAWQPR